MITLIQNFLKYSNNPILMFHKYKDNFMLNREFRDGYNGMLTDSDDSGLGFAFRKIYKLEDIHTNKFYLYKNLLIDIHLFIRDNTNYEYHNIDKLLKDMSLYEQRCMHKGTLYLAEFKCGIETQTNYYKTCNILLDNLGVNSNVDELKNILNIKNIPITNIPS
ncbi:Hypothetical protein ORPV_67 [Orpheovirus IHUMI-LCC2]|uniref:Uncharacterized protein n=1 Tax=Orpheovirus IHUMI-LCC2 TaxID=2023057 RepID=A0A2I2L369_9VIRU|nr:Hypothetical protein ORPV_67 [Orpheovirus IHUMI-LCC2]SNW61971.1 Hypothetical protein ORPV_67 [Orpheovirus IHUMI-LCC2]